MNVSNPLKCFIPKGAMIALLLSMPLHVMASELTPRLGIVNGHGGAFLIIIPEGYDYDVYQMKRETAVKYPPKAIVYKVSASGEPQKYWQVEGWYEFPDNLYLSYDAKTIVRVRGQYVHEDGSYGYQSLDQDLIAIFREGKKIAGYSATELFTDLKKAIRWGGRQNEWYHRSGDKQPYLDFQDETAFSKLGLGQKSSNPAAQYFVLHAFEYRYYFELETGEMLSREPYE